MKPVLLLDCDGILADFHESYLKLIEYYTRQKFEKNKLYSWETLECLGLQDFKIKGVRLKDILKSDIARSDFCLNIPVYENTKSQVDKLKELFEVIVVTSPMHVCNWVYQRTTWLEKNFNITKDKIIYASCKQYVKGDIFVDDSYQNCLKWSEMNPGKLCYLLSRNWNELEYKENKNPYISKIESLDNIIDIFECMKVVRSELV